MASRKVVVRSLWLLCNYAKIRMAMTRVCGKWKSSSFHVVRSGVAWSFSIRSFNRVAYSKTLAEPLAQRILLTIVFQWHKSFRQLLRSGLPYWQFVSPINQSAKFLFSCSYHGIWLLLSTFNVLYHTVGCWMIGRRAQMLDAEQLT